MDYLLIGLGIIFMITGILGGVLPILPGPPLSYIGLLLLHLTDRFQFSSRFLIIWAVITIVVYALDYVIPVWGTRQFGGSTRGVWGSIIGLIVGLIFLGPIGIILGPFVGAVVGELTAGKNTKLALKSGLGSFIGFLVGTVLKLIVSGIMTWHFATKLIS